MSTSKPSLGLVVFEIAPTLLEKSERFYEKNPLCVQNMNDAYRTPCIYLVASL